MAEEAKAVLFAMARAAAPPEALDRATAMRKPTVDADAPAATCACTVRTRVMVAAVEQLEAMVDAGRRTRLAEGATPDEPASVTRPMARRVATIRADAELRHRATGATTLKAETWAEAPGRRLTAATATRRTLAASAEEPAGAAVAMRIAIAVGDAVAEPTTPAAAILTRAGEP